MNSQFVQHSYHSPRISSGIRQMHVRYVQINTSKLLRTFQDPGKSFRVVKCSGRFRCLFLRKFCSILRK
jgi:hypothetical protein